MGPWAYGVLEGRQVDRWLASRAGWRADVLRDRTDCFSISFSSLETLSVLGEVGALFRGGSLLLFGVF